MKPADSLMNATNGYNNTIRLATQNRGRINMYKNEDERKEGIAKFETAKDDYASEIKMKSSINFNKSSGGQLKMPLKSKA
jgi:hypothetical protein